jgi:hypothetical protein
MPKNKRKRPRRWKSMWVLDTTVTVRWVARCKRTTFGFWAGTDCLTRSGQQLRSTPQPVHHISGRVESHGAAWHRSHGPRPSYPGSDAWWCRNHLRSVARESRDVLSLVSPQETEVGARVAVSRFGHAAMDAHVHADHGSLLLPGRARARMDRHHQSIRP